MSLLWDTKVQTRSLQENLHFDVVHFTDDSSFACIYYFYKLLPPKKNTSSRHHMIFAKHQFIHSSTCIASPFAFFGFSHHCKRCEPRTFILCLPISRTTGVLILCVPKLYCIYSHNYTVKSFQRLGSRRLKAD